jgi:hypothetical protein
MTNKSSVTQGLFSSAGSNVLFVGNEIIVACVGLSPENILASIRFQDKKNESNDV